MTNRSKFAEIIANKVEGTKSVGDALLLLFTDSIREQLANEGEAVFPGFGRLKIVDRPARKGHNPRTGEVIDIPAKQFIKFKLFPSAT